MYFLQPPTSQLTWKTLISWEEKLAYDVVKFQLITWRTWLELNPANMLWGKQRNYRICSVSPSIAGPHVWRLSAVSPKSMALHCWLRTVCFSSLVFFRPQDTFFLLPDMIKIFQTLQFVGYENWRYNDQPSLQFPRVRQNELSTQCSESSERVLCYQPTANRTGQL